MCKSLLYVEDLKLQQKLFLLLYGKEYDITTAATAEEGLDILKQKAFDGVVTDMHLGSGMDGATFANVVKKEYPEVSICLLTADMHVDLPNVKVIRKPFEPKELSFC